MDIEQESINNFIVRQSSFSVSQGTELSRTTDGRVAEVRLLPSQKSLKISIMMNVLSVFPPCSSSSYSLYSRSVGKLVGSVQP